MISSQAFVEVVRDEGTDGWVTIDEFEFYKGNGVLRPYVIYEKSEITVSYNHRIVKLCQAMQYLLPQQLPQQLQPPQRCLVLVPVKITFIRIYYFSNFTVGYFGWRLRLF